MATIWKYPVPVCYRFSIRMPAHAKLLSVQCQNGEPQLWAMVDPSSPPTVREFKLIGTGNPADGVNPENFVGTFQLAGGALVFHLFEVDDA